MDPVALTRLPDWDARLAETVSLWRARPFAWGAADCAAWAAACVEATTGWRPALPRYTTEAGAARALRRLGHASLAEAASAVLGPAVAWGALRRGDIVWDGRALGCWWYEAGPSGLFVGPEGLVAAVPVADWRGWKVG